jgi:hypothetical protein
MSYNFLINLFEMPLFIAKSKMTEPSSNRCALVRSPNSVPLPALDVPVDVMSNEIQRKHLLDEIKRFAQDSTYHLVDFESWAGEKEYPGGSEGAKSMELLGRELLQTIQGYQRGWLQPLRDKLDPEVVNRQ